MGRGAAIREQTITVDLSRGGASFYSRQSYHPAMKLRLKFLETQNFSKKMREIPAQVVRVIPSRPHDGLTVAVHFQDAGLANLTLSELLRSKIRTSSALLGIIQALSPSARVEEVIEAICRTTEKAMDAERAVLFLRDPQQANLHARIEADGGLEEFRVSLGEGLVGQAAGTDQISNVESLNEEPRYRPEIEKYFDPRTRSVLCVPLSKENGVSPGLLVVLNKRYGAFTREDEQLGLAVANQISIVLLEARLFEDVHNMKNYNEGVLQSIAAGVFTFDKSGKLVTANRAGTELLGFPTRPEVGKPYTTLFDQAANPRLCALLEDVLNKQRRRTAYDVRFLRRDGANLNLNSNARPLKDTKGDFLGGVLVIEDITQEQRLMNTLCRYVAREVAEQVLQDKDKLKLGGTRTEVSILFADIRNFTRISEQMDPEELVNLLNTYFPPMINVIFRYHGMVDKFIGDAILAVFGVPVHRKDDALRAVRAALDIRKEVQAINRDRGRKNLMPIEIGIGITSGEVISGNIGSERRMDFTVIGDPVNLAARLEHLTKELEQNILVNERVWTAVEKEIPCAALGMFKVKGKQEEVPVFAVKTLE